MNPFHQSWPSPSNPKPIVIIGAGGIVRDAHLPAYQKATLPVKGAFDVDSDRAAALANDWKLSKVYGSLQEATSENGNNVVYDLATPPHVIAPILKELPKGAAVLIQKPMGANLVQARKIRDICKERQLKAGMNFQLRFSPMMMAARDIIQQGLLGDLLEIEVHLNIYTPWHLFPFLIPMERVEIAVHSIHYLDTIRAIAGNPNGVFARTMGDPRSKDFAQTRTSIILDYNSHLRALLSINHNHQGGRQFQSAQFRFEGTGGAIIVKLGVCYDYPNGEPDALWWCRDNQSWEHIKLEGSWFIDAFMGTMRNVQRYDAGEDDHLFSSVEDAFMTMSLVEACFDANLAPTTPLQSV